MDKPQDADRAGHLIETLAAVNARSQKLLADYLSHGGTDDAYSVLDPAVIARTFQDMGAQLLMRPDLILREQTAFWLDYVQLCQRTMSRVMFNKPVEPVVAPTANDKRFKDSDWADHYVFDFFKQCYLLAGRRVEAMAKQVQGLDPHTARQVAFYTRQLVDAWSPSNFITADPKVLRATLDSGGENLVRGLGHLVADLQRGRGRLSLGMTDLDAFRLGENIGATPGKVVFQNDLMQLLQYAPATVDVHQRPLLIVPPWINKFYILDLKPQNSLHQVGSGQGTRVGHLLVNSDERSPTRTSTTTCGRGPDGARRDRARHRRARDQRHRLLHRGYAARLHAGVPGGEAGDHRVASATFFASLLDFADVGELVVFIDEEQIARIERHMDKRGFLDGSHMANAFNLLRENELIWSFVVNNYLLGREPMPFDLLYWNSDSTRMPAAMHSFYLRNMYLHNRLSTPGGITLAGVPVDLEKIKVPVYFLSTVEDHIAPWKSTYAGTSLVSGPVRFVLGGSGHIAGVINPPTANKYHYWTNAELAATPDEWLATAQQHGGSWWSDWAQWIAHRAGKSISARRPGSSRLPPIEDAPGAYVKTRVD